MRLHFSAFIFTMACGIPSNATATEPTTSSTGDQWTSSSTTEQETTSASTWISTGPTGGEHQTCEDTVCGNLAEWCEKYHVTAGICETIVESICPGDPCEACEMAPSRCPYNDEECQKAAVAACSGDMGACNCSYSCDIAADDWPEEKRVALCFVYPWTVGGWCDEPDEGMCITVMESECAPDACEYFECLTALEEDPCSVPEACERIAKCSGRDS